jgi:hypothetical protein
MMITKASESDQATLKCVTFTWAGWSNAEALSTDSAYLRSKNGVLSESLMLFSISSCSGVYLMAVSKSQAIKSLVDKLESHFLPRQCLQSIPQLRE